MLDLTGKVALVTGGASGIGAAASRQLAAGAHVVVADRDGDAAELVAGEVGGTARTTDVTDPEAVAALMAAAEAGRGHLDVVLLNAGISSGQSGITDLDLAGYRAIMGGQRRSRRLRADRGGPGAAPGRRRSDRGHRLARRPGAHAG
jgi:NAD(P)-dependent dehydrogenase (short-subunit alcohol dehydrogenase family)